MKPQYSSWVVWQKIDGKVLLIHPEQGTVHELDDMGTFLWTSIDGTVDIDDLVRKTMGVYDVSQDEAKRDIREFLSRLNELNLVVL